MEDHEFVADYNCCNPLISSGNPAIIVLYYLPSNVQMINGEAQVFFKQQLALEVLAQVGFYLQKL